MDPVAVIARRAATLALALALAGCRPVTPTPPSGDHADAPLLVPYPPPPAKVEILPPRPHLATVWVEGCWEWTGAGYSWLEGRWQLAPRPGAYYAPAMLVRRRNGELLYYRGRWHSAKGEPLDRRGAAPM